MGHYRLERQLGSGATATVWEATDDDGRYALKVLRDDAPAIARERMRIEVELMRRIDHANVVGVIDDHLDHEPAYVVLELVDGGTLQERIDLDGAVGIDEAIQLTLQLLDVLAAAHAEGIVHRDVKPSNVLLTRQGQVKLADFGIARAEVGISGLTQTGLAIGTLAYMAPEQRLDAGAVGPSADVYAVGAMLYQLVTGRTPMDLFAVAPESVRWAWVPPALRPALQAATEYTPTRRPQSAAAMAAQLRALDVEDWSSEGISDPGAIDESTIIVETDVGMPADFVRWYRGSLSGRIAALDEAIAARDVTGVVNIAHAIRGSAGSYGLPALGTLAGEVEDASDPLARVVELRQCMVVEAQASIKQPAIDTNGVPVLLVEDDAAMIALVTQSLRPDYRVVASNGIGVPALVEQIDPKLVLLDLNLNLPDATGFDILAALRAEGRDTPVVMLTASGAERDIVRAFDLGADDYVTKPPRAGELRARVKRLAR